MDPLRAAHCTLCGSTRLRLRVRFKTGTGIWACSDCANALTVPVPAARYDDHQFFTHARLDEPRWRAYSAQLVDFILRRLGRVGQLLDVGCSHGLLLEEAARRGFTAQGIEPSRSGVEYCRRRGLTVRHGYLEEGAFPPATFDVVVMAHVIEHAADPFSLLRTARTILKPEGVVCLSQTNYEGTLPRLLGRRWHYWVVDEHYYHFSPGGMERVLRRTGLDVRALELRPLGYHLECTPSNPRLLPAQLLNALEYLISRLRIGWPYRGDQMYVLAAAVT